MLNKKNRRKQPLPNLPEELIHEILRKLPAKSLCRFRCVSKPWNIQISSPNFFNVSNFMLFPRRDGNKIYSLEYDDSSASLSRDYLGIKQIRHPCGFCDIARVKLYGSCNGLVVLSYYYSGGIGRVLCVWNPYTEEYKIIPKLTKLFGFEEYESILDGSHRAHGFGYDIQTNDYKFVDIRGCNFNVYSLKSNTWKTIYFLFRTDATPGVFFNGALHWCAKMFLDRYGSSSYYGVLIALHVGNETVKEIPLPEGLDINEFYDNKYVDVLGGCLVMLASPKTGGFEVWMMKDYGMKESWVKAYNISRLSSVRPFHCLKRIMCLKNDEILLEIGNGREYTAAGVNILVLYDLKNERSRFLNLDERSCRVLKHDGEVFGKPLYLETYAKSLVSLDSGSYVGDKQQENEVRCNELNAIRPVPMFH